MHEERYKERTFAVAPILSHSRQIGASIQNRPTERISLLRRAAIILCLALGGCVTADLRSIAPSYAPATNDEAAEDFAAAEPRSNRAAASVSVVDSADDGPVSAFVAPPRTSGATVDVLIAKYASHYGLREEFVRKVVKRESNFNPRAHNRGHWGLMQIKHQTARGMGYRGSASGLLDPETNLIYAVRYLRGAWLVAKGNEATADRLYQSGYYYHAKRAGLLDETGLGRDRTRKRRRS